LPFCKMPAGSPRSAPSERSRAHAKVRARPRSSIRREGRVLKKKVKRRHHLKAAGQQARGKSAVEQPPDQHICPICHESYTAEVFPVVHAPCGHVACASCSLRWQEKKSSRTCALCRAPILSIAHCHMLEQLLKQASPNEVKPNHDEAPSPASSSAEQHASRLEIKNALQKLSRGDLNAIPGDYRSHIVRAIAYRALRKQDLPMIKKCLLEFRARASTHMFCDVANLWTSDPRPIISLLLEQGARINGHAEERPLLCAVSRGNNDMVAALLEFKADPLKATGPHGDTPLHAAACCGRFEAARILLDHGVPANIQDRFGRTPLFMAESGMRMHLGTCEGPPCQRCESRIQLQGELRWRTRVLAEKSSSGSRAENSAVQASGQQPVEAPLSEDLAQLDAISDYSSSEWEDSTDVSDVAEWLEGGEEEDDQQMEDSSSEGDESEADDEDDDTFD